MMHHQLQVDCISSALHIHQMTSKLVVMLSGACFKSIASPTRTIKETKYPFGTAQNFLTWDYPSFSHLEPAVNTELCLLGYKLHLHILVKYLD